MNKTATDLQLAAQKSLSENPHTEKFAIEVLDDNGVITLKGHVPSRRASKTAESIVERVPEVAGVINVLEVMDDEKGTNYNLLQFFRSLIQR